LVRRKETNKRKVERREIYKGMDRKERDKRNKTRVEITGRQKEIREGHKQAKKERRYDTS
jgi:hypothetical protein